VSGVNGKLVVVATVLGLNLSVWYVGFLEDFGWGSQSRLRWGLRHAGFEPWVSVFHH